MRLGEWDVAKMERGLTAKRFFDWQAYAMLEPFGDERLDYLAASIVQAIYNTNLGKDQKPVKLDDVRVRFGEPEEKKPQDWREQAAILKLWAVAHAGAAEDMKAAAEKK